MQTSGATKFNAKSEADTDREWDILWAIRDAQEKAYMEGDGEPQAIHLIAALQKHGLVIVEAARHDKLTATLQFVGSALEPIVEKWGASAFPDRDVWRALRGVVTRIKELLA